MLHEQLTYTDTWVWSIRDEEEKQLEEKLPSAGRLHVTCCCLWSPQTCHIAPLDGGILQKGRLISTSMADDKPELHQISERGSQAPKEELMELIELSMANKLTN